MTCPLFALGYMINPQIILYTQEPEAVKKTVKLIMGCGKEDCDWYDEKKKQCCIKTLAQKDNSKISVAR